MNYEELSRDFLSFALLRMLEDLDSVCTVCAESEIAKNRLHERISLLQNYLLMQNSTNEKDNIDSEAKDPPGNNAETAADTETAPETESLPAGERDFTLSELAKYNGTGGSPAYVAYRGVVYDVTNNPRWAMGRHFGMIAGRDLTIEYDGCHAGRPTLENLPVVGRIVPG